MKKVKELFKMIFEKTRYYFRLEITNKTFQYTNVHYHGIIEVHISNLQYVSDFIREWKIKMNVNQVDIQHIHNEEEEIKCRSYVDKFDKMYKYYRIGYKRLYQNIDKCKTSILAEWRKKDHKIKI